LLNTKRQAICGIDAGGTLVKVAYRDENDNQHYLKFRSDRLPEAAEWVRQELPDARLCLTGGKASRLAELIGRSEAFMPEFEATCSGAQWLLREQGIALGGFLLTNVGTGTSIHYIGEDRCSRIGGSGVGGGTIVGLSRLLTGAGDYESIVAIATGGERGYADLKVSHIYEGVTPPINGDLTASNFGRVPATPDGMPTPIRESDALASVIGMVGETVATVSVHAAGQYGTTDVVYIGSSFYGNQPLKDAVESYTRFRGGEPYFPAGGEFSGAVGAMLTLI